MSTQLTEANLITLIKGKDEFMKPMSMEGILTQSLQTQLDKLIGNRYIVAVFYINKPLIDFILDNYGQTWHMLGDDPWNRFTDGTKLDLAYKYPLLESQRQELNNILADMRPNRTTCQYLLPRIKHLPIKAELIFKALQFTPNIAYPKTLITYASLNKAHESLLNTIMLQGDESMWINYIPTLTNKYAESGSHNSNICSTIGFLYKKINELETTNKNLNIKIKQEYEAKIAELRTENKELLSKFNKILAAVTEKKTDDEEIADLQARIQTIYNKKRSLQNGI
jgi:hypothetical protein